MSSAIPTSARSTPRPLTRLLGVVVLTAGLTVATTAAAQAHVRVHADSTTSGSFSALTFRVPNESADAATVKVAVELPQTTPFLYVSSKPVPGWTATVVEEKLPAPVESEGTTITKAVRTVTWTADRSSGVKPGEYQEFSLSVGPLPAAGTVLLPATQTYSDGMVVHWDEPTPAGGAEPENPAPELVVTAAAPDGAPTATDAATPAGSTSTASPGSDGVARGLAGAGLALGLAALVVAVAGYRRRGATAP